MANVESSKRHALGLLIEAIKKAQRWSDEDIARRARARGHEMSKSNVSRIRNDAFESLNPGQMYALADGLGLPVGTVLQAALAAMGLPAGETPNRFDDVVRADPNLIPEARDHLLAQYALLLRIAGDQPSAVHLADASEEQLDAQMDQVIDRSKGVDPPPSTPIRRVRPKHK